MLRAELEAPGEASSLLPHWVSAGEEVARRARVITGVLMIADNAVAREVAERCGAAEARSRYAEETLWLYRELARR